MTSSDQSTVSIMPSSTSIIAFTGGGSAGHVTPNLALIEAWLTYGGSAIYIGRHDSVESELLASYPEIEFKPIPSERLRRYFHWGNFVMPFIVFLGVIKSTWTLRRTRPALLFSKGGFVALPVVIGAWLNRIPVVIHESDGSLGLANRLSLPFAQIVCLAQSRAKNHVKHRDTRVTGSPLRRDFFEVDPQRALTLFSIDHQRPLLVIFGGSLGAQTINEVIWAGLDTLLSSYEILHVVGSGNRSDSYSQRFMSQGYHQLEYIKEGFADLLALAHLVICRAGANTIAELVALKKPALLVPLSTLSSRGDQALNAEDFVQLGGGAQISNETLTMDLLLTTLKELEDNYSHHTSMLAQHPQANSTQELINIFISMGSNC
jgi:UDP-N-acetylglucosamine--N-acetylmuramyl-(pentapeptide) pyrophosphoryl-undecaprenol N-acetylglucosamine transferase